MKEEALKLAERLEIMNRNMPPPEAIEASIMIRSLVEELDKRENQVGILEKALMQSRIEKSLAIADRNRLVEK